MTKLQVVVTVVVVSLLVFLSGLLADFPNHRSNIAKRNMFCLAVLHTPCSFALDNDLSATYPIETRCGKVQRIQEEETMLRLASRLFVLVPLKQCRTKQELGSSSRGTSTSQRRRISEHPCSLLRTL